MGEWNIKIDLEEMDSDFVSIRSLFISASISKMYQLVKQSPTKIARLLGLNYEAYHDKLLNPEKFTELHINTLSYAIQIDPVIIHNIIQREIRYKVEIKIKKFEKRNSN